MSVVQIIKVFKFNHTAFYCCLTKSDYCMEFYMFVKKYMSNLFKLLSCHLNMICSYNFEVNLLQEKTLAKFVIKY